MKSIFIVRKTALLLICSNVILFWGCKTNSLAKSELKLKNQQIIQTLYNQNNYNIEIEVVHPFNTQATTQVVNALLINTGNSSNRIDVRGDGNFIKIKKDSITGYLPFFGERRLNGGDYGGQNVAIQFDEVVKELKKNIVEDKPLLELEFSAKQKGNDSEKYDVKIEIFPNENVSVHVTPVFKTFIKYEGRLSKNTADN